MSTPDEVRDMLAVLLNQIPPTMLATQAVLTGNAGLGSIRSEGGEVVLEDLAKLVNGLRATLLVSVIEIDNRLERLEGRPGISDGLLDHILGEFGLGG